MTGEHMTPDEFRRLGHEYVDWVASYWERVGELPGDDADVRTTALLDAVNASGRALLTPTVLDGRPAIRICVGQTWTTEVHVDALWDPMLERLAVFTP